MTASSEQLAFLLLQPAVFFAKKMSPSQISPFARLLDLGFNSLVQIDTSYTLATGYLCLTQTGTQPKRSGEKKRFIINPAWSCFRVGWHRLFCHDLLLLPNLILIGKAKNKRLFSTRASIFGLVSSAKLSGLCSSFLSFSAGSLSLITISINEAKFSGDGS